MRARHAARPASREFAVPGPGRLGGCARARPAGGRRTARGLLRLGPRRAAPRRGDRLVRAGAARVPAAGLGDAALRRVLAAPGPDLRAPGDAVPRSTRGDCDVALVPAQHRAASACAPPSYLAALHLLPQAGRALRRRRAARAARARRLQPRHPGGRAGRILRARRADRPVPDGQRACPTASTCSTTRSRSIRTFDVDTQRTHLPGDRKCACCRRASSRWTRRARTRFRARFREKLRGRPVASSRIYKDVAQRHRDRPASSTTCRCSSTQTATLFDYLPARGDAASLHGDVRAGDRGVLARHARRATACCAATATGRCCRRAACSCRPRSSSLRAERARAPRRARRGARRAERDRAPLLPTLAVDRRAAEPLTALQALPRRDAARACCSLAEAPGRRETHARSYFAEYGLHPAPVARASPTSTAAASALRARASRRSLAGFVLRRRELLRDRHRDRALRRHGAPPRGARRRRAQLGRGHAARPVGAEASATRWCTRSTASAATSAWSTSTSAKARPSSCTSSTPGGDKLYVPVSQLHLISRYSGGSAEAGAAAQARQRPVGEGQAQGRRAGARHRRRAAQPLRAARRARGPRVPASSRTTTRPSPTASASRRRPTSPPRSTP